VPKLYGVGYPPLERAIDGRYALGLLLLLLVGKVVATSLTIAIGGSGGVFAPSLFMGAMLGTGYGVVLSHLAPTFAGPAGAYGLVGMGAVFAGAARAPITAVIIVFELTGEYSIILPLMFAIVLATGMSTFLSSDTIYTLKLRRRGIDLTRGRGANFMQLLLVRDAMHEPASLLGPSASLNDVIEELARVGADALPVLDHEGRYRGTVTLHAVEQAMRENALDADAAELARETPVLTGDETLEDALAALLREGSGLPVVADGQQLVGWLSHQDVLRAYNDRLRAGLAQSAPATASSLARLRGYRVVRLQVGGGSRLDERFLGSVDWPESTTVLGVIRDGETVAPSDDLVLHADDCLVLLLPAIHADRVVDAITAGR
jgi:CIC family chloride channel protein